MKKIMLTGLVALAAAAGVGCANMHYNERGLIEQEGSERLYHEVTRTPETLELAVRVMDDGVLKEELVVCSLNASAKLSTTNFSFISPLKRVCI